MLGNHRLIEERGQCDSALEAKLLGKEQAGHSVTLLASDQGVLALFAVADTIRGIFSSGRGRTQNPGRAACHAHR